VLWLREIDAQQSMLGTSLHSAKVTPTLALKCLPDWQPSVCLFPYYRVGDYLEKEKNVDVKM
jgi:hypothetical protein